MSDSPPNIRIGHGYDSHKFSTDESSTLVLGGVAFEELPKLEAHSDGDAISHGCIDALLSPVGLGDVGAMFSDTDERWAGASSFEMLQMAVEAVKTRGWSVGNMDVTVVCERPRIGERAEELTEALANVVEGHVSVKGKRPEGLEGRGDVVEVHVVALLVQ